MRYHGRLALLAGSGLGLCTVKGGCGLGGTVFLQGIAWGGSMEQWFWSS